MYILYPISLSSPCLPLLPPIGHLCYPEEVPFVYVERSSVTLEFLSFLFGPPRWPKLSFLLIILFINYPFYGPTMKSLENSSQSLELAAAIPPAFFPSSLLHRSGVLGVTLTPCILADFDIVLIYLPNLKKKPLLRSLSL